MALQYPIINGCRFDWSSVTIKLNGVEYNVKELSYDQSLTPGMVYGNRAQKVGRTRGKHEASASMTLYKSEASAFIKQLSIVGGVAGKLGGYMEVAFDIVCAWSEPGQDIVGETVKGCRIKKHADDGAEGEEASVTKFDLDPMGILPFGNLTPIRPDLWLKT